MKVLAIMGSPRKKGHTLKAVERVKDELLRIDDSIDFEYLFLGDSHLEMCKGCFGCFAGGADKCPLKDDRDMIYNKMTAADGIILAAPTYAMGVPALMKNFIDRFAYTLHRPCFFDQAFMAVSTVGGVVGMKQALGQLALLAAGAKKSLKLGVPMPPVSMPMIEKKAAKRLKKTSKAFYAAMRNTARHKPGLVDFSYFGAFKSLSRYESYKKECPADNEYYSARGAYFYPVKGLRAWLGRRLAALMRFGFNRIVKEDTQQDNAL